MVSAYCRRSFTTSGQFKHELRFLPYIFTEISYTEDTIILKSLVALVFVLDTLHTLLISAGVWQYFVIHFGDDTFLSYTHPPLLISIVVTVSTRSSTLDRGLMLRTPVGCFFHRPIVFHIPDLVIDEEPFQMDAASYPNALCICAASSGCRLHGRSNVVSNEPFRCFRTPAY
jgi:hypothetical protein